MKSAKNNPMETLYLGDCLEEMKKIPDGSVDLVLTDPPYELGFMGKSWDSTGIANNVDVWKQCLRVLKPGGYLLSFGGTRTYHRMASAIEDAGFEVRDMIEWVYGSGFPKSRNIGKDIDKIRGNERKITGNLKAPGYAKKEVEMGKQNRSVYDFVTTKGNSEWEGWGTALKPAHEPICMARKPLAEKTVAENVLKYGTGGINIDISRVSSDTDAYKNDGNNENNILLHKLSELRCKIYTLLFSFVADKKDFLTPSNDIECVEMWKKLEDCLGDYSVYRHLYDALPHLFLNGDQVSAQQLHDVLADIDRLRTEQKHNLSSQYNDHLSNLDVFYQLILSYLDDTTLYIKKQESVGRFPANLLHDNSEEVRECFPENAKGEIGRAGRKSGGNYEASSYKVGVVTETGFKDNGNASRFFKSIIYQAKASKSERNKGLDSIVLVDIIKLCNENNTTKEEKLIRLMVTGISPQKVIAESGVQLKNANEWNTCLFGKHLMEKYQEDIKSITKTETNSITTSQTLNWLTHLLTNEYTVGVNLEMGNGGNLVENAVNSNTLIITINEAIALALGVKDVVSGMQLKINVKEGSNIHSTVKPTALMEYLVTMASRERATVLDPFMGSGTTGVACKRLNRNFIGIEMDETYFNIAKERINKA